MSKSLLTAIVFSLCIYILNLVSYLIYPIEFGQSIIGWDELQWQESSIYFFENGFGLDAIKFSLGIDGGFNNLGWPYLLGLFHYLFGMSYFNVIYLKLLLYFLSIKGLYDILKIKSFCHSEIILAVICLTFYHPMFAIRLTYLRDDIVVYLIIILLGLSSKLAFNLKSIIYFIPFLFFSYILLFTRAFALLVYFGLSIFYFRFYGYKSLIIFFLLLTFVSNVFFDIIGYSVSFINQFRFDLPKLVFDSAKFYIGPLPWQMFGVDSGYNPLWYVVTLFFITIFFLIKPFYKGFITNWRIFFFLYLVGFMPYHISSFSHDAIGPRQFGMIAPFLFIILYLPLISKILGLKRYGKLEPNR